MDVSGEHDVGSAQSRRRGNDALANPGWIDADDRGVLEDPRPRPPRQRGQPMHAFATIDLKRLWIIHAVEITDGLGPGPHTIPLRTLDLGLNILAKHFQARYHSIAHVDV